MPKLVRELSHRREEGADSAPRPVVITESGARARRSTVESISIGVLLERAKDGQYLVEFSVAGTNRREFARLMNPSVTPRLGQKLVLAFEEGDQRKPVILGMLEEALGAPTPDAERKDVEPLVRVQASVDGRKVVVSAEEEIVLSCGKASITLTRAGKVIIRGEYLISRSTGVNCIRGGVVQIN